jgi:hypothetical protein
MAIVGGAVVLAWMRRHPIPEPVIAGPDDDQPTSEDAMPAADAEPSADVETSGDVEPSADVETSGGEPSA